MHRDEREALATRLRDALTDQYKSVHNIPEGAPIDAADRALLSAATSALLEVELTTARLIAGRARSKALKNLGFARSELRRSLRSLGLIANDGETPREDPADAPPEGATDEEKREWSRRYVDGVLAEEKVAAS